VLWIAVGNGVVGTPDRVGRGELRSSRQRGAVEFVPKGHRVHAGSAVRIYDLVLGYYSVQPAQRARPKGQRRIREIRPSLPGRVGFDA